MRMKKLKPGAWKWFLLALIAGMATGVVCVMAGVPGPLGTTLPAAVAAGAVVGLKTSIFE